MHNLTKQTVVLSDLRAEINPHKMLDLEKVSERSAIERSHDLRLALNTSKLRLCSQGVVTHTKPIEKIIEKHHYHNETITNTTTPVGIDEDKLVEVVRKVMQENKPQSVDNTQVLDAVTALQKQISSLNTGSKSTLEETQNDLSIDIEQLANMQSKAIERIGLNIETGTKKTGKKIILKNMQSGNLADEL